MLLERLTGKFSRDKVWTINEAWGDSETGSKEKTTVKGDSIRSEQFGAKLQKEISGESH